MADDFAFTPGVGATGAADLIGGVYYPRVKVTWGPDGTANDTDIASGKPMPVQLRVSDGTAFSFGSGANGTGVQRVALATDSAGVVNAFAASATFTPAAASHTGGSAGVIGDCNGAAQTFTLSPAPVSGSVIMITDAELEIDGATAEATAWRLYLYNVTPPSAIADDGAFTFDSGDRASALGYIDLGTAVDHGNTQWVEVHGINKMLKLAGTTVFGYLVNLTTLTPQNVAHVIKLYGTPV